MAGDTIFSALQLEREPWVGEQAFFASHPDTTGMMTEDGRITMPSRTQGAVRESVRNNELVRLLLQGYNPTADISPEQKKNLVGTAYENGGEDAKRTMLGRAISRDPSYGKGTFSQDSELRALLQLLGPLGGVR